MVTTVPAKRGRKPAATTAAQPGGQVQSLTRGLKLLEWIAESHGSVALTELAQQAGPALPLPPAAGAAAPPLFRGAGRGPGWGGDGVV